MTHPEELLAPYVDGTASPQERAAVDAHASSCARCRGEIATATAARTELRRLPVVDAPPGLAPDAHVVPAGRPGGGVPGWYRWAGAAAVAAVIVLLVALVLPNIGKSPSTSGAALSGDGKATAPGPVQIEIQAQDYEGTTLRDLLKAQAGAPTPNMGAIAPASAESGPQTGTRKQATDAQACIKTAFRKVPGRLIRLISARFAGGPAYIGIYAQGPRGQPADTIVGRVASADTCSLLSIATARIGP